jgi:hypothetical protein
VVSSGDWSTHQLAEFLALVSSYCTEEKALSGAAERVAEALDAEIGVAVVEGTVRASVGFSRGVVLAGELLALGADWQ